MAIKISQGFQRTSANPVDMDLALTKAQMKTVNDNLMPNKYFTICQDDGALYLYDKTNTVDETTGKFRKQIGASDLAEVATSGDYDDLNGVPIINLTSNTTVSLGGIYKVKTDGITVSFRGSEYTITNATANTIIVYDAINGGTIISPDEVYTFEINGTVTHYVEANAAITGATKPKITYDSKGLVTGGADLSASDIPDLSATYIATSLKGTNNGVAELDNTGKVPTSQLPSYVDDVIEGYYYNGAFYEEAAHTTEITPSTGKIYVDLDTNKTYRWSGSVYVEISQAEIHKYIGTITGDGTTTSFTISHGLNTRDVTVNIYDGTTYEDVIVDVTRTSTSAITVSFAQAPANNITYKVVIVA